MNASALVDERALGGSRIYAGASLRPAGRTQEIVSTQAHHALDDEFLRDLKRAASAEGIPAIWIAPEQASFMQILLKLSRAGD